MAFLQTARDRAALLILGLAVVVLIGLAPFASGLLGAGVLYVACVRPYRRLEGVSKPGIAAATVLLLALVLIALPITWLIGRVIDQAPDALRRVEGSDVIARLGALRVGDLEAGGELAKASSTLLSWLSSRLVAFFGGATSFVLNVVIAFFGLYYLLRSGTQMWAAAREYIPFSQRTSDALVARFFGVTQATLLGTTLTAVLQGAIIGAAFALVGLPNPVFWGVVAGFTSILPVVGSTIVWLPGALVLLAQGRTGSAALLAVVSGGIAGNINSVIRPVIYKRVSDIHPMISLVGAFAGVRYFGLLGILLGPLAIAYLFELLRAYRDEYGTDNGVSAAAHSDR